MWLLAKLDSDFDVGRDDRVATYALFANSHDGSIAFRVKLTTIRVVCQNTLALALDEPGLGKQFRRSHSYSPAVLLRQMQAFWNAGNELVRPVVDYYRLLSATPVRSKNVTTLLGNLFPIPAKPRDGAGAGVWKLYEIRREESEYSRNKISELLEKGKGVDFPGVRGTYWGLFNAITEFVDHHQRPEAQQSIAWNLLGDGNSLKTRALRLIREELEHAA